MSDSVDLIDVDLTEEEAIEGGGSSDIPDGEYHFQIEKIFKKQSQNSGNMVATKVLRVKETLTPDKPGCEDAVGSTTVDTSSLDMTNEFVRGRWKQLALACKVPLTKKGFNLQDFVDAEFVAEVTHSTQIQRDEVNGKQTTRSRMNIGRERPVGEANGASEKKAPPKRSRRRQRRRAEEDEADA